MEIRQLDDIKDIEVRPKPVRSEYGVCQECLTPLTKDYVTGEYGGKFCDKSCYRMFTED